MSTAKSRKIKPSKKSIPQVLRLDACEKIDYLKIALSKRKTPKLTEYRDEPSDY